MIDPREVACALGGSVSGHNVIAPGPGHSRADRSLSIKIDPDAQDGFLVFSFAGDDPLLCRDYVRAALGLPDFRPRRRLKPASSAIKIKRQTSAAETSSKARALWRRRHPIISTPAERYLRVARGYAGPIPQTLGYLPASGDDPHALIAGFGMTIETEPGMLQVSDEAIRAVHLTRLIRDGSDRDRGPHAKIVIGRPIGSPIVIAPVTDMLGLVITEGIEDALSTYDATGLGAWAAGSAPLLPSLCTVVPAYTECVTIMVDSDKAGRHFSRQLAASLAEGGIEVRTCTVDQVIA